MVVFDTTVLVPLLDPQCRAPHDPKGNLVSEVNARMNYLVQVLREKREKILIPTPVLAETLIHADKAAPEWFIRLNRSAAFRIEPFDAKAAVELAHSYTSKREGSTATMAKIKFDRQIVAIAKANKVQTIYSSDNSLKKFAEKRGITVIAVWDLPLPPAGSQRGFWDTPEPDATPPA